MRESPRKPSALALTTVVAVVIALATTGAFIVFGEDKTVGWLLLAAAGLLLVILVAWIAIGRERADSEDPKPDGPVAVKLRRGRLRVQGSVFVGHDRAIHSDDTDVVIDDTAFYQQLPGPEPTDEQRLRHWSVWANPQGIQCACGWRGPVAEFKAHRATSDPLPNQADPQSPERSTHDQ